MALGWESWREDIPRLKMGRKFRNGVRYVGKIGVGGGVGKPEFKYNLS